MVSQLSGPHLGPNPMQPGTAASTPLAFECWLLCQCHHASGVHIMFLLLLAGCILVLTGCFSGDVQGRQLPMMSSEDSQDMAAASASGKHDICIEMLSVIFYMCWQGIHDI